MIDFLFNLWDDYTSRTIMLGTILIGSLSGTIGCIAVLRKQSLLGDAISHAALPGIVLAFMFTGTKKIEILLLGALIAGLVGSALINIITKKTHLKTDTALGIVLSVFFGFGLFLLTILQKTGNAQQSGLDKFLFGQAAALQERDLYVFAITGFVIVFVLILFWKELKLFLFDAPLAKTLGYNTKLIEGISAALVVSVIVIGLQTIGVVLMSAILLAPAAAARQWTNKLERMVILAAIFGALSGLLGTIFSTLGNKLPTGPLIVLSSTIFVLLSFIFSPNRGILFKYFRYRKNRNDLQINKTLAIMFDLSKNHEKITHTHKVKLLNGFKGYSAKSMIKLEEKDFIKVKGQDWHLTEKGYNAAKNLYNKSNNDD